MGRAAVPESSEWRAARVHLTRTTPRILAHVGTWRSLVARTLGVGEAAGSNPVVPTISIPITIAVYVLCRAAKCGCMLIFAYAKN